MQAARNIVETRISFTDSLTTYDICKVNKGTKPLLRMETGKTEITDRLQLVSTNILGPVTSMARGNNRFMAKYSDHYNKFGAVYFI